MRPTNRQFARALRTIGWLLEQESADYCFEGRFRFDLADGWSLVVSADDAERFRLEACYRSRVRATLWTRARDEERLRQLVLGASQEAAALAA